jgi:hypothetical protein
VTGCDFFFGGVSLLQREIAGDCGIRVEFGAEFFGAREVGVGKIDGGQFA